MPDIAHLQAIADELETTPMRDLYGLPRWTCKRCTQAISEVEHIQGDDLCNKCRQGLAQYHKRIAP